MLRTIILFTLAAYYPATQGLECWVCENAPNNEACLRRGRLQRCQQNEKACQNEVRRGSFGILITKRCKQALACDNNYIQNPRSAWYPSQCNSNTPSSVCRCCCGLDECNKPTEGCSTAVTSRADTEVSTCPSLEPPVNGGMKCSPGRSNNGGIRVGTKCYFTCKKGYVIKGSRISTCTQQFDRVRFNNLPPTCIPVTCPVPPQLKNGEVWCSKGNKFGSECIFTCGPGFRMNGHNETTCVNPVNRGEIGRWFPRPGHCVVKKCPRLSPPKHGSVTCSNDRTVGSECSFKCDTDGKYKMYPSNSSNVTCGTDQKWDKTAPCCSRPCPPYAKMDLVLVLDSSSSIGLDSWNITRNFAKNFVESFEISSSFTQVAAIRFNSEVDKSSTIWLSDHPNNKATLLSAIENIPYDGTGTKTGKALKFVNDAILKKENGDRHDANDIIVVVTDGNAQDNDVLMEYSAKLRNREVLIYAVGVFPPSKQKSFRNGKIKKGLDKERLIEFAGSESRVLIAETGFEELDEELIIQLSQQLCTDRCRLP